MHTERGRPYGPDQPSCEARLAPRGRCGVQKLGSDGNTYDSKCGNDPRQPTAVCLLACDEDVKAVGIERVNPTGALIGLSRHHVGVAQLDIDIRSKRAEAHDNQQNAGHPQQSHHRCRTGPRKPLAVPPAKPPTPSPAPAVKPPPTTGPLSLLPE